MKKKTQKRSAAILCIGMAYVMMTTGLLSSCESVSTSENPELESNQLSTANSSEVETEVSIIEPENEAHEASQETEDQNETIRMEEHNESASLADNIVKTSTAQASTNKISAVTSTPDPSPKKNETAEAPILTPTPSPTPKPSPTLCPTASPTPSPKPTKSESTATPKPTAKPTAQPTEKPMSTPKPTAVPTAKPTPAVTPTPTPAPKTERVWIVDIPGHYETVTESKEVWIDEQGHYEEDGYWASDWVYQCNQCGAQYPTMSAMNQHLDDSFDWDTMTGHSSYTQVSGPTYWVETEPVWIVDVPGHYETITEYKEVWVEEQGHWETITI